MVKKSERQSKLNSISHHLCLNMKLIGIECSQSFSFLLWLFDKGSENSKWKFRWNGWSGWMSTTIHLSLNNFSLNSVAFAFSFSNSIKSIFHSLICFYCLCWLLSLLPGLRWFVWTRREDKWSGLRDSKHSNLSTHLPACHEASPDDTITRFTCQLRMTEPLSTFCLL